MTHESKHVRNPIIKALSELDAVPVENPACPGTPDVWTLAGWIELKELDSWPVRETTTVKIPHFTVRQRGWLKRNWFRGGLSFVIIKVGRLEWLLLDGYWAAENIGKSTRAELVESAIRHFSNGLDKKELLRCLQDIRTLNAKKWIAEKQQQPRIILE